jgi:hypothetical protein
MSVIKRPSMLTQYVRSLCGHGDNPGNNLTMIEPKLLQLHIEEIRVQLRHVKTRGASMTRRSRLAAIAILLSAGDRFSGAKAPKLALNAQGLPPH